MLIGTYVLSAGYYDAYYLRAQKIRALILKDFTDVFARVDALLTPTAPSAAFAQGEKMDDPIKMYLNDLFTVPANLAGVPAISVPAGLDANGLPLGLQVIGKPFDEETVFAVSAALEQAAGFPALPAIRAGALRPWPIDLQAKTTQELETIVANCARLGKTGDPDACAANRILADRKTASTSRTRRLRRSATWPASPVSCPTRTSPTPAA